MILSLSGGGTTLGSARKTDVGESLLYAELSHLSGPIPPEKLVTHASIGIAQELGKVFQTKRARTEFTSRLAFAADCAYALFRSDIVSSIGDLLVELPCTQESMILGRYYQALGMNRAGFGDRVRATPLFQQVADEGSPRYRDRALIALGNRFLSSNDPMGAVSIYREVIRLLTSERSFELVTFFNARKMMAVARALSGDHRGSLDDLEKLLPLVRTVGSVQPHLYYDYLNALAVELGEEGKLDQARHASSIAVASPFAGVYPAWRETFDEIAAKRPDACRSIVAVPCRVGLPANSAGHAEKTNVARPQVQRTNLLLLRGPDREPGSEAKLPPQTKEIARVINFQQWKVQAKPPAHLVPGKLSPEQKASMTTGEKLIRLMDLISRDETNDQMIDRILDAVEAIVVNGANQELD